MTTWKLRRMPGDVQKRARRVPAWSAWRGESDPLVTSAYAVDGRARSVGPRIVTDERATAERLGLDATPRAPLWNQARPRGQNAVQTRIAARRGDVASDASLRTDVAHVVDAVEERLDRAAASEGERPPPAERAAARLVERIKERAAAWTRFVLGPLRGDRYLPDTRQARRPLGDTAARGAHAGLAALVPACAPRAVVADGLGEADRVTDPWVRLRSSAEG